MAYKFNFDLSRLSQSFFIEIAKFSHNKNVHGKMGETARFLVKKFKIDKMVGISVSDAITLVEDLFDTQIINLCSREDFKKTKKRALLLPHCSRKYMDSRCKARFDTKLSSYFCTQCSKDCLVNMATELGKKQGYDVYVLPGGSCIRKIMNKKYDGIVGVACCEEIKLAMNFIDKTDIKVQGLPLIKNGCANTKFRISTLKQIL